jgi:diadenylate cyclase
MFGVLSEIFTNMHIAQNLAALKLKDIIDIIIVASLVYVALIWLKRTGAWLLANGFFILLVVYAFARVFSLDSISFIITKVSSAGLIALMVIFQPELRKALEQLGKGRFLNQLLPNKAGGNFDNAYNAILQALAALSKTQTGALIIMERNMILEDFERTGVSLNADISVQLLINVFTNKTPLHDGAALVRGNKIIAASCILPLTNEALDKRLGTRHRAAVGATEHNDAIALVVSEETGEISYARDGQLFLNVSDGVMHKVLFGLMNKGGAKL